MELPKRKSVQLGNLGRLWAWLDWCADADAGLADACTPGVSTILLLLHNHAVLTIL